MNIVDRIRAQVEKEEWRRVSKNYSDDKAHQVYAEAVEERMENFDFQAFLQMAEYMEWDVADTNTM